MHRYFAPAIVTAHQTKKLMLCHIDRVFRGVAETIVRQLLHYVVVCAVT